MDKALPHPTQLNDDAVYRAGALAASDGAAVLLRRALVDIEFLFGQGTKTKAQTALELRALLRPLLARYPDQLNQRQKALSGTDKAIALGASEYDVAYRRANKAFHDLVHAVYRANRWLPK